MTESVPEVVSVQFLKNVAAKLDNGNDDLLNVGGDTYTELSIEEYKANPLIVVRVDYDRDVEGKVLIRVRHKDKEDSIKDSHHDLKMNPDIYQVYDIPFEDPGIYEFDIFVSDKLRGSTSLRLT